MADAELVEIIEDEQKGGQDACNTGSKNPIWDFFTKDFSNEPAGGSRSKRRKYKGKCMRLGCQYVEDCPTGATSALIHHLKAKHPSAFKSYVAKETGQ